MSFLLDFKNITIFVACYPWNTLCQTSVEKEKKTEAIVLKLKIGSHKSTGVGSIPTLLCRLWGQRTAVHQSLEEETKQNKKPELAADLYLQGIDEVRGR